MIEHTKKLVEDKFTTLNGYEHNAEVLYLENLLFLLPFMHYMWFLGLVVETL